MMNYNEHNIWTMMNYNVLWYYINYKEYSINHKHITNMIISYNNVIATMSHNIIDF